MIIESLELESFGKYRGKKFDFKPVTVFFGMNESGKTTILDALLLQLIDRAVNSGTLQLLQARYGAYSVKLKPEALCKTLSLSELENFYIVRSSRMPVEFSGTTDAGTIKTRLLDGKVNIQTILDDLKRELGERAENSVGKRRVKLEQLVSSCELDIRGYDNALDAYAEKTSLLNEVTLSLKALEEERQGKERAKKESASKAQELRASEERGALALLYERLRQWLSAADKYKEEKAQWNLRYGSFDTQAFESMLAEEEALRQRLENERSKAAAEAKTREHRLLSRAKLRELRLFDVTALISGFCAAAGVVAGLVLRNSLPFIFSGFFFAAGLVVVLLRSSKAHGIVAETRLASGDALLDTIKKVRAYAEKEITLEAQISIETITRELGLIERKKEELFRGFGIPHVQALRAMIAEKSVRETALEVTRNNLDASVPRAELASHGFSLEGGKTQEDAGIATVAASLAEIARGLKEKLQQDSSIPLSELRLSLKVLEEGLHKTESELVAISVKKDKLLEKKTALQTELASFSQKIMARAELKRRAEVGRAELAALEEEEKAKRVVQDILEHMQEGRNTGLQFIEEGMNAYFSHVFSPFSSIKVPDIGKDSIAMPDSGGNERPVPLLSQGTQDLFYAGFRMLLGEYLWENRPGLMLSGASTANRREGKSSSVARTKPGFFLWDEPFVSLDDARLPKAVEMLMLFQKQSGFQHIVFTKDPKLARLLREQGSGASHIVHELSPLS